jgi:hypothetical protein
MIPTKKRGVNPGVPEELVVAAPLVTPVNVKVCYDYL